MNCELRIVNFIISLRQLHGNFCTMAKKKKEEVKLNFQDLITQPRQLARLPMMNKMTGYRVLIAVLQRLQGLWKIAKMPDHDRKGQLYLNFVTNEFEVKKRNTGGYNEGDVVFKLRLSEIALDSHYDEARLALTSLTHIKCFIPDKDKAGYFRTGNLMEIRGKFENGQFVGTDFEVIIPRLVAENILDINLFSNYTRFVGYTAGRLRSSFSYPLYIYLSEEWRHHGSQFVIPIRDLRFRLGFVKDSEDPDRETRYSAWSTFCVKVLDQAKRELDDLAKVGGADFTFVYQGMLYGQPLPPYKRPDAVAFTILPTKVGEELQQVNDYTPNKEIARKMMTGFYGLTAGQTYNLLRRVGPAFMPAFLEQLIKWKEEIESGSRSGINNRPGWAYKSIDEFIRTDEKKHIAPIEEATIINDNSSAVSGNGLAVSDNNSQLSTINYQLESFKNDLHAAWRYHKEDKTGLTELIDSLQVNGVDQDGRVVFLTSSRFSFTREFAVPHYWEPSEFDQLISRHFNGFSWRVG